VAQLFVVKTDHWAVVHTCFGVLVGLFALVRVIQALIITSTQITGKCFLQEGAVGALVTQFVAVGTLDKWQSCGPPLKSDLFAKHGQMRVGQALGEQAVWVKEHK
jgi:hypothetical protein